MFLPRRLLERFRDLWEPRLELLALDHPTKGAWVHCLHITNPHKLRGFKQHFIITQFCCQSQVQGDSAGSFQPPKGGIMTSAGQPSFPDAPGKNLLPGSLRLLVETGELRSHLLAGCQLGRWWGRSLLVETSHISSHALPMAPSSTCASSTPQTLNLSDFSRISDSSQKKFSACTGSCG